MTLKEKIHGSPAEQLSGKKCPETREQAIVQFHKCDKVSNVTRCVVKTENNVNVVGKCARIKLVLRVRKKRA